MNTSFDLNRHQFEFRRETETHKALNALYGHISMLLAENGFCTLHTTALTGAKINAK